MKTKRPTPRTITAEELSAITNLKDRRLRQLADLGYLPQPKRGRYDADAARDGFIRYLREQLDRRDDSLRTEQTGLTRAKREMAEAELAKFRGEFVRVSELIPAISNTGMHQRIVLQRVLEQELGPNLQGLSTLEIMVRCRKAVDDICGVFREGMQQWAKYPPSTEKPENETEK